MKRLFLIAGLMAAFMLVVVAASAQDKANFAGTWNLDKAKSQGLSQGLMNAESVVWAITQDAAKISIESKVVAGAAAAPSGTPGGGGGGGGRPPAGPRTFNLDGKEVSTEGAPPAGGTNVTKATWSGATLELSAVRTGSMNGQDFKSTRTDKLSLSADGKVLTVVSHSEGPRGPSDSTMVFNKP